MLRCCLVPTVSCKVTEFGDKARAVPFDCTEMAMFTVVPPAETLTVPVNLVFATNLEALMLIASCPWALPASGFGDTDALSQFPPLLVLTET